MKVKKYLDELKERKELMIHEIQLQKEIADSAYKKMKKWEKNIKEFNYLINLLEKHKEEPR